MSRFVFDLLQTVTFDVDFSDLDWLLTDEETIEQLCYGRDCDESIDLTLN